MPHLAYQIHAGLQTSPPGTVGYVRNERNKDTTTFNFQALPPVLREQIYEFLLEEACARPLIFHFLDLASEFPNSPSLPIGFMSTRKQIHHELMTIFGKRGKFKLIFINGETLYLASGLIDHCDLRHACAVNLKDPFKRKRIFTCRFRNLLNYDCIENLTIWVGIEGIGMGYIGHWNSCIIDWGFLKTMNTGSFSLQEESASES
ncbi:hypothetical protein EJ08DRAFT_212561 [Tothia fuscella]|uniref:Uncharacterized protein n=1 Tax=Tothia fuscella TaxID=1048955 RepID=A0A9P4TZE8_9PEZI|nr:hypothetical protein EJ08DRAFT_212561 [Tothia fuscella]